MGWAGPPNRPNQDLHRVSWPQVLHLFSILRSWTQQGPWNPGQVSRTLRMLKGCKHVAGAHGKRSKGVGTLKKIWGNQDPMQMVKYDLHWPTQAFWDAQPWDWLQVWRTEPDLHPGNRSMPGNGAFAHIRSRQESPAVSTAGCTKQSQHIKPANGNTKKFPALCKYLAGCFGGVPTWQAHPKRGWHPPPSPALTGLAPRNPSGSAGSPRVLAAGRAGHLGTWDALCPGTGSWVLGSHSLPRHCGVSLSSQQCLGLRVGA